MGLVKRWGYGPFFQVRFYLNGKQIKEEIIYESQTSAFAKSVFLAKDLLQNIPIPKQQYYTLGPEGQYLKIQTVKFPVGGSLEFIFKRRR